jgi:rare lipoprotein A
MSSNAKPYFAIVLIALGLIALSAAIAFRDQDAAMVVGVTQPTEGFPAWRHIELARLSLQQPPAPRADMVGVASWYGAHWQGRKTASGTRFDVRKLTAAERSLPLNSHVRVTNLENGRSVVVLINDRGPYVGGRMIDLSTAAARRLGMIKDGLALVRIEIVAPDSSQI